MILLLCTSNQSSCQTGSLPPDFHNVTHHEVIAMHRYLYGKEEKTVSVACDFPWTTWNIYTCSFLENRFRHNKNHSEVLLSSMSLWWHSSDRYLIAIIFIRYQLYLLFFKHINHIYSVLKKKSEIWIDSSIFVFVFLCLA